MFFKYPDEGKSIIVLLEDMEKAKESKHTVDSYLRKFTSEDNASFEELAALHNKKERIRNSWMYDAEEKHNKELVYRGKEMIKAADEQLMIAAAPNAQEGCFQGRLTFHSFTDLEFPGCVVKRYWAIFENCENEKLWFLVVSHRLTTEFDEESFFFA